MTINNQVSPTYTAQPWEKILLRLVNTSNARIYNLDLRNIDATVVESDGGSVKETYQPGILQMGVGERYTLLVTMPEQLETILLSDRYFPNNPNLIARISVEESGWSQLAENLDSTNTFNGDSTVPDWRFMQGNEPDYVVDLGWINVSGGDTMLPGRQPGRTIEDTIFPETPEAMWHANPMFTMQQWEAYTVRLQNNSWRDHPMHLHGDFFQVIGVNGQKWPYAWWKDTVNVPAKGYTDIVLVPTNPGVWMFHCHINEHAEFGMMATIKIE